MDREDATPDQHGHLSVSYDKWLPGVTIRDASIRSYDDSGYVDVPDADLDWLIARLTAFRDQRALPPVPLYPPAVWPTD